ncbi:hypothetical protein HanRHA438_Chr01g0001971 [Helianthus annuus]|uniref:Uncharacterized protein n=1 Tax=Helianthus annuus TaxID=4232 RepID=A0A251VKB5_HELAN|nr:hypothetical protein HanXRQr2_Chr01g0001761 [Helianthus annuus]KAJ0610238.1 hypothetical protein HanHA300_Chr01g0001601 [Helianthus annuus]KAJ0620856.1 hypothetical protein HanIR_Chr01g0002141 [Helianthus annuus]KAJ0625441.1 hypothetical protein HanHA89_Chr01g0001661 [Helianthus annuus]KAJ0781858.1 hypothetical protein HanLR1_Chr01g0001551 [Helianthus annuus]
MMKTHRVEHRFEETLTEGFVRSYLLWFLSAFLLHQRLANKKLQFNQGKIYVVWWVGEVGSQLMMVKLHRVKYPVDSNGASGVEEEVTKVIIRAFLDEKPHQQVRSQSDQPYPMARKLARFHSRRHVA